MPGTFGIEEAEILGACDSVPGHDGHRPNSSAEWFCEMEQGFLVEGCVQKQTQVVEQAEKQFSESYTRFAIRLPTAVVQAPVLSIREIQSCGDEAAFHGRWPHVDELAVMQPLEQQIVDHLSVVLWQKGSGGL